MKKNLLTISLLLLGACGIFASEASANSSTTQVPFAGTVLDFCNIVPNIALPGVLTQDVNDSDTLTSVGNLPGTMTVLCNTEFQVTSDTPTVSTLSPTAFTIDSAQSSIRDIEPGLGVPVVSDITGALLPNSLYTVKVDMSATSADSLEAGVYAFEVPVVVTCL